VANGSANLLTATDNDWGDVSVRALTRTLLAVTVTLDSSYAFVVSRTAFLLAYRARVCARHKLFGGGPLMMSRGSLL
jgi:hypothetical protein